MENHKDFHHDDLLDRAVNAVLREPTPDDLPPDRVAQLAAAVRQAADQPFPITIITRIKNMRPRTRIAVAATVLVAVFGLMSWLVPGSGPSLAFADVAEALTKVRSVTWKTTTTVTGPSQKTITWSRIDMYLAPSYSRTEMTSPEGEKSIIIVDGQKNKAIRLDVAKKTATVSDWGQDSKDPPPANPSLYAFQGLQKLFADAKSGKSGKVDRLGVKTIDRRPAEGFRIQQGDVKKGYIGETTIWADSTTMLPVRLEQKSSIPSKSSECCMEMTDFQVGADLDKSLFSLDVPEGYTVEHKQLFGKLTVVQSKEKKGKLKAEPPKSPEPKGRSEVKP